MIPVPASSEYVNRLIPGNITCVTTTGRPQPVDQQQSHKHHTVPTPHTTVQDTHIIYLND